MKQSDSQFTIFNFHPSIVRVGGQIDFQVEAATGYWTQGDVIVPGVPRGEVFIGEKSVWSNTQTLTISPSSASPSPDVPEFPLMAILPLLGGIFVVVTVLVRKKKVQT
jgi:hypothetical protein